MKTCAYNIHKAKNVLGTMIQITYLKCEKKKKKFYVWYVHVFFKKS